MPLLVMEAESSILISLRDEDPAMVVWGLTPVETASGLARKRREGTLSKEGARSAMTSLRKLRRDWMEISDLKTVVEKAIPFPEKHGLKAADATQLAAALLALGGPEGSGEFVVLDGNLRRAAGREGLKVLPV